MSRPDAWTSAERAILDDIYPREGLSGTADALPDRSWHAIQMMAHKRGLRSPVTAPAPKPVLQGDALERAIAMREAGQPFAAIARESGVNETAATNAVLIALCTRRGYRPAERDAFGRLTAEGKERLRFALKKGLKAVDIQLRLGISGSAVHHERRRYNADLVARGKAPLPPPGNGEQYSGVRLPAARRRAVEAVYLDGFGTPIAAKRTGVASATCKRIRTRLVDRLAKKGQTLPGCDLTGRRIGRAKHSDHFVPPEAAQALHDRLLAREPVARAARALGIGGVAAYRIRDELVAELAARGEQLPKAIRLGRGPAAKAAYREANWLPADRLPEFRRLTHEHGLAEAKRLLIARMADERRAAIEESRRPKSFDEQLALVAAGKATIVANIPLRRPDPTMTLGGIATGAL